MQQQSDSSVTRRDFLVSTAGYALAVCPVTAWAITTPDTGLEVADVMIPVGADKIPAYIAKPKKSTPSPVIIVIHEIFGVHEYIRDICRRLAKDGYVAISPYLYSRHGDVSKIADFKQIIADVVSKVPQSQVFSDIDATIAYLKTDKAADTSRLGITGFCWGGSVVWTYSHQNPALKAGVAWYGKVTWDANPLQSKRPLDIGTEIKVPVLGLYGDLDTGIPIEQVEQMRTLIAKSPSGSMIHRYAKAQHGFHADYRPSYDETSAKDGWAKLLDWFDKKGLKAH